jgi:hypothetical protein
LCEQRRWQRGNGDDERFASDGSHRKIPRVIGGRRGSRFIRISTQR